MELYCYYVMIVVPVIARTVCIGFYGAGNGQGKRAFSGWSDRGVGVAHW